MAATPPATIVMPLLRQVDAFLERALESAVRQTVPAEVVVVVSPRTPPSNLAIVERVSRSWPLVRPVMRPPGAGFPGAINAGIRVATAQRIGLLLTDDWLDEDAIETCLPLAADIVSAGKAIYAADGTTLLTELTNIATEERYARLTDLREKAEYLRHFFLFQRAALEAVGGLDETLGDTPGIDDFDLIWTLLEHGAGVAILGRSVYNARDHDGERMTLRDPVQKGATLLRIFDKHGFVGPERPGVYERHVRWYGRTLQEARRAIDEGEA